MKRLPLALLTLLVFLASVRPCWPSLCGPYVHPEELFAKADEILSGVIIERSLVPPTAEELRFAASRDSARLAEWRVQVAAADSAITDTVALGDGSRIVLRGRSAIRTRRPRKMGVGRLREYDYTVLVTGVWKGDAGDTIVVRRLWRDVGHHVFLYCHWSGDHLFPYGCQGAKSIDVAFEDLYFFPTPLRKTGVADIPVVTLNDILRALKHENASVRMRAAVSLRWMREDLDSIVRALIGALEDEDSGVRYQAVWSLGLIGPSARAAIRPLERLAKEAESLNFRRHVERAIEWIVHEDD